MLEVFLDVFLGCFSWMFFLDVFLGCFSLNDPIIESAAGN